jgi:hypothetical protein
VALLWRAVLPGAAGAGSGSSAKAKRELGWAPAVSTYRDGVRLKANASR